MGEIYYVSGQNEKDQVKLEYISERNKSTKVKRTGYHREHKVYGTYEKGLSALLTTAM